MRRQTDMARPEYDAADLYADTVRRVFGDPELPYVPRGIEQALVLDYPTWRRVFIAEKPDWFATFPPEIRDGLLAGLEEAYETLRREEQAKLVEDQGDASIWPVHTVPQHSEGER